MSDFYNEPPMEDKLIICEACHGVGSVDAPEGMKDLVCDKCKGDGLVPEPPPDQEMLDNNDRMGDEQNPSPQDDWDKRIGG